MILTGDFETHFTKDYSLTKMSEVEYVLDPRFEAIMLSLKRDDNPSEVHVGEPAIRQALSSVDWSKTAWLSHNTRFDGAILAWRFGHVPGLYLDTLSMARATLHWVIGKSSLRAISEALKLAPKGTEVENARGKRLVDFTPEELDRYKAYCIRDNENCWEIFQALRAHFNPSELKLIDLVLRMFVLPQVRLDERVLDQHLAEVRREKQAALAEVSGIDKSVFSSNVKFAKLLEDHGVDVPMKISPTTGSEIPAIARNDWAFKELCADGNQPPIVQALLATRMSVKSTIDETRAESLLGISRTTWPTQGIGWAPVPLKYSGARTHRLSGDGGTNWQNLRRGSLIRKAIVAPEGYRIVHRDASQIEARMVAWLAGCDTLLSAFAEGRDVYSEFASVIYSKPVTKADVMSRFIGKTAILSLGYSAGAARFRHMLYIGSGGISKKVSLDEAGEIVDTYRNTYREIPKLWRNCNKLLDKMVKDLQATDQDKTTVFGSILDRVPVLPTRDSLWLPNNLCIRYPDLDYHDTGDDLEMCYKDAYGAYRRIYGAKIVENISQALSRIIVTNIILRVEQVTGYHPWLSCHDSLGYCVPEGEAKAMDAELERQFAQRPSWAADLPLASEGGFGRTLLDAERGVNQ